MIIYNFEFVSLLIAFACIFISMYSWRFGYDYFRQMKRGGADTACIQLESALQIRTESCVMLERESYTSLMRRVELGRIAQGLFHDLTNALSGLMLHIESTIESAQLRRHIDEHMHTVCSVTERMRSFIANVRTAIQEQIDATPSSCRAQEPLSVIRDLYRHTMRVNEINLSITGNESIQIPLHKVEANQLFMNIVSNAIDSFDDWHAGLAQRRNRRNAHNGRKKISIEIAEINDHVQISICDNGKGIADTFANSAETSTKSFTSKKDGTGIGLVVVRDIVMNKLKGSLSINSAPGEGTIVTIIYKNTR